MIGAGRRGHDGRARGREGVGGREGAGEWGSGSIRCVNRID